MWTFTSKQKLTMQNQQQSKYLKRQFDLISKCKQIYNQFKKCQPSLHLNNKITLQKLVDQK